VSASRIPGYRGKMIVGCTAWNLGNDPQPPQLSFEVACYPDDAHALVPGKQRV